MSDLELQKFLRSNSVEDLQEQYGIKCSVSEQFPELHLFKYSQIDSPMGERIVQEARGIILNGNDNWSVVARPYDKFFNYGEGHAAEIDWTYAKVYEKLDGSLITMYWYEGEWRIATSGNPDASGEVWNGLGNTITFKDLFWQIWDELGYTLPDPYFKHFTFMFELMTPFNKVVVQHTEAKIVLHGVRMFKPGFYVDPESWKKTYGWDVCKTYDFNTIEAIVHNVGQLDPIKSEGYVVVDAEFNRIKVKSPQYVALHHMRDTLSPRRMLEVIRANEGDEFLTYFPEFQELYDETKLAYNKLRDYLSANIADLCTKYPNPSRKDIGLATKGQFWQGMVFPIVFDGKSIPEMLAAMPIKKLEDWILKI